MYNVLYKKKPKTEYVVIRVSEETKQRWKKIRRKYSELQAEEIFNLALDYFEKYHQKGLVL
jgi:hypothetical protein